MLNSKVTLNIGQVKVIISKYSKNLDRSTFSKNTKCILLFLNIYFNCNTKCIIHEVILSEKGLDSSFLRILRVLRHVGNNSQTFDAKILIMDV